MDISIIYADKENNGTKVKKVAEAFSHALAAQGHSVTLCNAYLEMGKYISSNYRPGTLFLDGVHWNGKGHGAVADFLRHSLLELNWL